MGRALGAGFMDRCYANLTRDADGLARTTLTAPDGRATTLWQGEGLDYTHIFITDGYPGRSHAVAIEPMQRHAGRRVQLGPRPAHHRRGR